jgi:hypothetical protein
VTDAAAVDAAFERLPSLGQPWAMCSPPASSPAT